MRKAISKNVRQLVAERAEFYCEYCHFNENDRFLAFEIDHVISLKHGGGNEIENLAYACPQCNQNKGTDLVTFLEEYDNIVPLFNPRKQDWNTHFYIQNGLVCGKTDIGEATIKLLKMNDIDLVILRQLLF
jgi:5-methylcytosine-specific restriction endonuclease McrA